jgi:hypothetical protein
MFYFQIFFILLLCDPVLLILGPYKKSLIVENNSYMLKDFEE